MTLFLCFSKQKTKIILLWWCWTWQQSFRHLKAQIFTLALNDYHQIAGECIERNKQHRYWVCAHLLHGLVIQQLFTFYLSQCLCTHSSVLFWQLSAWAHDPYTEISNLAQCVTGGTACWRYSSTRRALLFSDSFGYQKAAISMPVSWQAVDPAPAGFWRGRRFVALLVLLLFWALRLPASTSALTCTGNALSANTTRVYTTLYVSSWISEHCSYKRGNASQPGFYLFEVCQTDNGKIQFDAEQPAMSSLSRQRTMPAFHPELSQQTSIILAYISACFVPSEPPVNCMSFSLPF